MKLRQIVLVAVPLLLSVTVVAAQVATCAPLVETALDMMDEACSELTRNQVCYGHTTVQSQLREAETETVPTFDAPADVVDVLFIEQLESSPLNTDLNEWGIAVMNLQADVPETLPGQAVVFLLLGQVQVVDGATGRTDRDPMQAFYFSAGVGPADCNDAPSTLAVRSPEDVTVNLTINGMDVTLGSMITLVDNQNSTLTITTHEGSLGIPVTGTVVGVNQSVDVQLNSVANVTTINAPRPAKADELALVGPVNAAFDRLENDPAPTTITYTVQAGDNLFRIAEANNTCIEAIVAANSITDRNVISVGQVLTIPQDPGDAECQVVQSAPPAATTPAPVVTPVSITPVVEPVPVTTDDPQPVFTPEVVDTEEVGRGDSTTPEVLDPGILVPTVPVDAFQIDPNILATTTFNDAFQAVPFDVAPTPTTIVIR